MQRERSGKVNFLLGKTRCQARESTYPCPDRQIAVFNVPDRDHVHIGIAANDCALNAAKFTGANRSRSLSLVP